MSTVSFVWEGLKIGLFFGIKECTSHHCSPGHDCYLSFVALISFLLLTMYTFLVFHSDAGEGNNDTLAVAIAVEMTSSSSLHNEGQRLTSM